MNDPLAGCSDIVKETAGYATLLNKLLTHLSIIRGGNNSDIIADKIRNEMFDIGTDPKEYQVNELQYEIRLGTIGDNRITSEGFENVLINRWFKIVYKRDGEDTGLRFVNMLKGNREKRKMD
jgi:hypothetical protein